MKSIINNLDLENYIDSFKKFYARDKEIAFLGISPDWIIYKSLSRQVRIFPRRINRKGLGNFRIVGISQEGITTKGGLPS